MKSPQDLINETILRHARVHVLAEFGDFIACRVEIIAMVACQAAYVAATEGEDRALWSIRSTIPHAHRRLP